MRKKVVFGLMLILVFSVLTLTLGIETVYASPQIDILTHSGWLDSIGCYHVSGEVENIGDSPANFVKITATFYDSTDTVVATSFSYTMLEVLLPGRKSPFDILLTDTGQAAKVHHYSLSVTSSPADSIPLGLEILSNSSYVDDVGCMHVVGEIKNVEAETTTYVMVVATFYNSTGHVVAAAFAYSDPSDIDSGQTAPFEILLTDTDRVSLVASYALTAQSDQYALIPEFSPVIMTSLFMILAMFAVVSMKEKSSVKK